MSFRVYDQNYLLNQEQPTPFPQVVKFEARGQLSSEYGIAAGSTVSVSWTPVDNDILYAKLYDINGTVLAQDTIHAGESTGEWVDLGLPSGLLWATRNVGATSPEDYGDYFAWGEITPKSVYKWNTYRYFNSSTGSTKYTTSDGLTILQPGDDAATANYGGRTPTKEEWQELMNNTNSQWITQNGVFGQRFTGPNGNSLFLPAAGFRRDSSLYDAGSYGCYWSSSLDTGGPYCAWGFSFRSGNQGMYDYERYCGRSVRAVRSAR